MPTALPFIRFVAAFWLALVPSIAPAQSAPAPTAAPLRVVVTIPPLLWPVRALIGSPADDAIPAEVSLILRPGLSEHGFELTPSQMRDLQRADIVVMAGHGLEPRVAALVGRSAEQTPHRAVVTLEGLTEVIAADHDHEHCEHEHDHDHDHEHDHPERPAVDPHLWLDPIAMKHFVARVADSLRAAVDRSDSTDEQKAALKRAVNLRLVEAQAACDRIDAEYARALAPLRHRAIVTHHNAYAYLCKRYNLTVAAVIRPVESVEPTPGDVMKAVSAIRDQKAGAVFIEPQFPAGVAKRIADAAGVKLETIDPLGDGDWPALMRANLSALLRGLAE